MGDYNRMLQDSKGYRRESGSTVPSLIRGPLLFCACVVAAGMVQLQSLPSQHQWLPSKSSTVVMDEEKKRDYSSWQDHWLMFCFPYAQVSLLLEIAFSRLNSPSSNAFSVITGPLLGFCFSRGNFCIHSFIFLSFMSPVIVFCLLLTAAGRLEPSDSHKGHHSLLALLPGFNEWFYMPQAQHKLLI